MPPRPNNGNSARLVLFVIGSIIAVTSAAFGIATTIINTKVDPIYQRTCENRDEISNVKREVNAKLDRILDQQGEIREDVAAIKAKVDSR